MPGSEDDDTNDKTTVKNIYRVSVKYAPFNREDPEIWFTQLETQFQLGGISVDATKYGHLIAALDNETLKCVREKVLDPPAVEKYTSLKQAIIDRICDSAKIKLNRLLSGLQLGDKKPSQLLREMQALSVNHITDDVLRNLWLQRLPLHSQEILSSMEDSTLDKLAKTADKIAEVNYPSGICSVGKSTLCSSNNGAQKEPSNELKASIDALSKRFEHFEKEIREKSRSRNKSNNTESRDQNHRSRARSKSQVKSYPNCWFHYKFGVNAKNCKPPCSFKGDSSSNSKN